MTVRRRVSRLALTFLLLSGLVGSGAMVMFARTIMGSQPLATFAVPGSATVELDEADNWAVFERTGSVHVGVPDAPADDRRLRHGPEDITVTGPDGGSPAVTELFGGNTITTEEGDVFQGVAEFDSPTAGSYRIEVAGGPSGDVLVARQLGRQGLRMGLWLLIAGAAGFVLCCAGVGLVVSLVRRTRVSA